MALDIRFGDEIKDTSDYAIYQLTNIKYLLHDVKIWKGYTRNGKSLYNREKNDTKVDEIYESLLDSSLVVPSFIYISDIYDGDEKKNKLRCWDGQHRWNAIKKFYEENHTKDISHMFICIIYKNDTDKKVFERFYNLNKMTPVNIPNTEYSESETKAKRIVLSKEIVDMIKEKWPTLISTSQTPRKPNYNVEMITENIRQFIEDNECENMNSLFLMKRIEDVNIKMKKHYDDLFRIKPHTSHYIKARDMNAYIFLLNDFTEHIELDDTVTS